MIMQPTLQAIFHLARQTYGYDWFDGDEFISKHFHEDFKRKPNENCARHLLTLVERGFFESEGFYLRVKRQ